MKSIACASLLLSISTFTACASTHASPAPAAQDEMDFAAHMPAPIEEHAWLQQLVGEWDLNSTMSMGPGTEPIRSTGREKISALGGFWIVCENEGEMPGMGEMQARMTLGYDPLKGKFLGTWVDSHTSHMWVYSGSLDAGKQLLTLDAIGPDFSDPSQSANYRDAIQLDGRDHKVITSSVQGDDGKWTSFISIDCRRTK